MGKEMFTIVKDGKYKNVNEVNVLIEIENIGSFESLYPFALKKAIERLEACPQTFSIEFSRYQEGYCYRDSKKGDWRKIGVRLFTK